MYKIIYSLIIIFTLLNILGHSRIIPEKNIIHSNRLSYLRRWGRWCSNDYECGHGFCQAYKCQCYRGYITWKFMDVCNYKQRTKLTAFLVSFFVGIFGIDWFVLSQGKAGYIIAGIIKLIISLGCITAWPVIIFNLSKKKPNLASIATLINVTFSLTTFIWWLTDWIRVLAEVFYDGNGAPLQTWGYNNNNDRFPYRV
ncbi:unnamed protein product [Adineta steineri]|uniref:TM2 domain-containing protein n=1 Tax=Adineta steineri TaxID=433720 RepID=A0A814NKU3_9BILA|nr:unnamed protein product [Adineta steineri]CAF3529777.1 unnamed protein product [Adineta steineri]